MMSLGLFALQKDITKNPGKGARELYIVRAGGDVATGLGESSR